MGSILPIKDFEKQKSNGVLIVDDMLMMRLILSSILKDAGIPILGEAANGQKALELYARTQPSVVLLDLLMPVMDGFSTLEKLLNYDPKANVIICSSLQQKFYISRALKSGAKDFLIKPFRPDAVKRLVGSLIHGHTVIHQYPRYLMID